jgi:hypothetical protein
VFKLNLLQQIDSPTPLFGVIVGLAVNTVKRASAELCANQEKRRQADLPELTDCLP